MASYRETRIGSAVGHRLNPAPSFRLSVVVLLLSASALLAWFIALHPIRDGFDWDLASTHFLMLVGVAALGLFLHLAFTWSVRHALLLAGLSLSLSTAAELAGLSYGLVFGEHYRYHPSLSPRIAGVLPIAIPVAWFVLSCLPLVVARPWLVGRRTRQSGGTPNSGEALLRGGVRMARVVGSALFCAVLLGACDLYLEPLSVYSGLWHWSSAGDYLGAPVSNLAGWVLVGFSIYLFFFSAPAPASEPGRSADLLDSVLILLFIAWVSVALAMIHHHLESTLPSWLTLAFWGPPVMLRLLRELGRAGLEPVPAIGGLVGDLFGGTRG